jgi:FemAB-related protein (PEP-CTERM system-associated)
MIISETKNHISTIVETLDGTSLTARMPSLEAYVASSGRAPLSYHIGWLTVLNRGLDHRPYCLEATEDGRTRGILPLCYVRSLLFGRFLVGLPYLNYGGVIADDGAVASQLIDHAVALADRLRVRYLEVRHEKAIDHPALSPRPGTQKVHMRLPLPRSAGQLWDDLSPKTRNQVRKGQKSELTVAWGGEDFLPDFYEVFSENMRDLGTPVFGRRLFAEAIARFPGLAEFCVVRTGARPIAAALLVHGSSITEVPSASALRAFNPSCANMLLYWHLLVRAIERGQAVFDFGRSSLGGSHYKFKEQWGACPHPAEWQFYVRHGGAADVRPNNPRYQLLIRAWKRIPLPVTRWLGPSIVRGIP